MKCIQMQGKEPSPAAQKSAEGPDPKSSSSKARRRRRNKKRNIQATPDPDPDPDMLEDDREEGNQLHKDSDGQLSTPDSSADRTTCADTPAELADHTVGVMEKEEGTRVDQVSRPSHQYDRD